MTEDKNKQKDEPGFDLRWGNLLNVLELFRRYFSGQATPRERNSVETWEPLSDEAALLNDQSLDKECDTDSVWNAVAHELKFDRQPKRGLGRVLSYGRQSQRFAAAMLLFVFLGVTAVYLVHQDSAKKYFIAQAEVVFQTTNDQTRQLELPDGTQIHLNRGTKIHYLQNAFNKKQREVWLEGEAFFDVSKNPDKPFIIHTGEMTTTVKGTSFNVKAYPQLGENVVSVRTGKVQISRQGKQLAMLTPDEQLIYHTLNNRYETEIADGENAAGWRNGSLIFNSANIEELKLRLKHQYHVDLVIRDKALKDIMLNSSFAKGTTLNEVMNTIADFYNVKYSITASGQVILSE